MTPPSGLETFGCSFRERHALAEEGAHPAPVKELRVWAGREILPAYKIPAMVPAPKVK